MRPLLSSVALVVACVSCGSNKSSTPANAGSCPRDGTVIANMRDVERDAEGVSYAVFGPAPDHVADYTRATGVLSLLRQVWEKSNQECPDLPAKAVASVDSAIDTLDSSLPAEDQSASAYAANDIHLQMAPLFAYFNPDTPVEVVRMDAVFLRIGVDAWSEDWSAFSVDLDKLNRDWATLKDAAVAKIPTCSRVAGTASVVDDVDQSLANLADVISSHDLTLADAESDAGLLEVDILELLFDCPVGTDPPETGLGSACSVDDDCNNGLVCNHEIATGRCSPAAAETKVGATCTTTVDCGSYSRNACNNEVGDGFPGGYCSMEPCDDVQVCSPGATCVAMPFETPACMQACSKDSDCRTGDGYACQLFPTTPPAGFGPTDHACAFPCSSDAECTTPLTCNVANGKCIP